MEVAVAAVAAREEATDGGGTAAPSAPAGTANAIRHIQLNRNKGFKCGFCEDKVLKNKTGLKRHVTATHADDPRSEVFNIVTESEKERESGGPEVKSEIRADHDI